MEKLIFLNSSQDLRALFGKYDRNLRIIEKELDVQITPAEKGVTVNGRKENIQRTTELIDYLMTIVGEGREIKQHEP